MSDLWLEIYSHLMERDEDALKMQNIINIEMERLLIPTRGQACPIFCNIPPGLRRFLPIRR